MEIRCEGTARVDTVRVNHIKDHEPMHPSDDLESVTPLGDTPTRDDIPAGITTPIDVFMNAVESEVHTQVNPLKRHWLDPHHRPQREKKQVEAQNQTRSENQLYPQLTCCSMRCGIVADWTPSVVNTAHTYPSARVIEDVLEAKAIST